MIRKGTQILTNKKWQPIEELSVGDFVTDPFSPKANRITNIFKRDLSGTFNSRTFEVYCLKKEALRGMAPYRNFFFFGVHDCLLPSQMQPSAALSLTCVPINEYFSSDALFSCPEAAGGFYYDLQFENQSLYVAEGLCLQSLFVPTKVESLIDANPTVSKWKQTRQVRTRRLQS